MAGSNFGQVAGGLAGLGMALYGAYNNGPKASSNKGFIKRANSVGMMNYGASDMAGLMSQINNTPTLQMATRRDFYDPSSEELFGSFFGSGMAAYGASQSMTAPLRNLDSVEGWEGISVGASKNANPSFSPTGNGGVDTEGLHDAMNRGDNEAKWDEVENAFSTMGVGQHARNLSAASNVAEVEQILPNIDGSWASPQYTGPRSFACGGHKFGGGGSALATGIDLSNAGLGILFNYLGQQKQREIAEREAVEANATNLYAQQMLAHNQGIAVNDTKNNMFNQQALQMMAMGGDLQTHGADYPLLGDYNVIGAGGTHEQNPFGGVFQGMAADGKPNLVEEDEVIWNDYVFSNRLTVPKDFAKERKLKEGITYAEAAKKLAAEAEERPNDPISQNGMADALGALQASQEELKQKREAARIKRAISKMSPEEVMNMVVALQSPQSQAQPMEQPMPVEQPLEQQPMFAEGGYLGAYHELAKADPKDVKNTKRKQSKAERAAAEARDRGLMENYLSKVPTNILRDIASKLPGYNADDFNNTDANNLLRQFIMSQYGKTSSNGKTINMESLNNYVADRRRIGTIDKNSIDYTRNRQVSYDNTAYNANRQARQAYDKSRNNRNSEGTYTYEDNMTREQVQALEGSADYKAQTNYILDQLNRARNGLDYNAEFLENYFTDIDNNIPISQRNSNSTVQSYLQYNPDGSIKRDAQGRAMFADDIYGTKQADGTYTGGRYYAMRNDGKTGMVHQPYVLPTEVVHNPGERTLYRVRGKDGNYVVVSQQDVENNPYYRKLAQSGADTFITDEHGDKLTTHYVDFESPEYEAEYTPETVPGKKPPLPTWMRYAPLLSGLGALQGPAKDYSTGVTFDRAHYTPIGDYLPYLPVDTQRYINAENQQAAAQLNAIMNASAGNRNMAMAQAALANSQRQQGIGQRMQAAEQINWDRLAKAGEFNRGTNMFNAQAHNQAELANLQINPLELRQAQQNAMMRYQADKDRDAAVSESLNAFLDSFGGIGRENFAFNQANSNEALRFDVDANPWFGGRSDYKRPTIGKTETITVGAPSSSALGGYLLSKPKKNRR